MHARADCFGCEGMEEAKVYATCAADCTPTLSCLVMGMIYGVYVVSMLMQAQFAL